MSDIRNRGIRYLSEHDINEPKLIAVSKWYSSEESWTKKPCWWFDLPLKKIQENKTHDYYLLGELNKYEFVVLKVPNEFFISNISSFDLQQDIIRLHISAEDPTIIVDDRGKVHINFSPFKYILEKK